MTNKMLLRFTDKMIQFSAMVSFEKARLWIVQFIGNRYLQILHARLRLKMIMQSKFGNTLQYVHEMHWQITSFSITEMGSVHCTVQLNGRSKFLGMNKVIAMFLSNPDQFTGHSFRRTSATLLADGGGDITDLKRHGGWKSPATVDG